MLKYNAIDDLCALTAIKKDKINKVLNKLSDVICDDVLETKLKNESSVSLDVGYGNVVIFLGENNKVSYSFIPNERLSKNIEKAITKSESVVERKLENDIVNALIMPFKELY